MRWAHVTWLGSLAVAVACGGRFARPDGDEESGGAPSGQGGSGNATGARPSVGAGTSSGARTGSGASTGQGGTGVSMGGKVGFAGSTAAGGGCATCPPGQCAPGSVLVTTPEGCCLGCRQVSDCNLVPCPNIACASGFHLEVVPGACCPTCIADRCAEQYANYRVIRDQLIEKYQSLQCAVNSDCTLYYEANTCSTSCGIPVPIQTLPDLEANLSSAAAQTCSRECAPVIAPCEPPSEPLCIRGRCQ
jgi:hypothetical protein